MRIDPKSSVGYDRSMDAAQNAWTPSASANLRRYVLDSLAIGRSVSIQCSDAASTDTVRALGERIGALHSTRPSRGGWAVRIMASPGLQHFDIFSLN